MFAFCDFEGFEKLAGKLDTTINNCELNWLKVAQMFAFFRVPLNHEQRASGFRCVQVYFHTTRMRIKS